MKSIQVFRKPVEKAVQGDRCGICISNFDPKQFERGYICSPNFVRTCYGVIINLEKVKYFKNAISSGSKFHISIGHETLLGKITLFADPDEASLASSSTLNEFDFNCDYIYLDEINMDRDQNKEVSNFEPYQKDLLLFSQFQILIYHILKY